MTTWSPRRETGLTDDRAAGYLVVGDVSVAAGAVARRLARVRSACMPVVDPHGFACASSNGAIVLTAATSS